MADFQNPFTRILQQQSQPEPEQSPINIEDFMPQDPEMDELSKRYKQNQLRAERAQQDIEKYQAALEFDPQESASKRYKDKYKWKGASLPRKLGTIGFGVMDLLSNFDQKGGIRGEIQRQEQQKFDNLKNTVPGQITTERLTQQNANTVMSDIEKRQEARDKNNATIAYKNALMKTTNEIQREKLRQGWEKLSQTGQITTANVNKLFAETLFTNARTDLTKKQATNPQNAFEAANMEAGGKLNPNFLETYGKIAKAGQRPQRAFSPRVLNDPTENVFSYDPLAEKFDMKKITPRQLFNPNTGEMSPMAGVKPSISRSYTNETEVRQINDMQAAHDMLKQATGTLVDDLRSGKIKDYSGFNDTAIMRQLNAMLESNPDRAIMRSMGQQIPSFATLNHIKAIYGGRAPQELVNDIAQIVEGRGASGLQKTAAMLSQRYATEMYLHAKAGDMRAEGFFADPNFYKYLKGRSTYLLQEAQRKNPNAKPPSLNQLIKDYEVYSRGKDTGKNSKEVRPGDPQVSNPIYQKMLQQSGNN